jgi:hypothetical protein
MERIPGNHCNSNSYLAKRARAQSGACAEVQFPDYGTELWSPGSRKCSRKITAIPELNLPRERELSLQLAQSFSFLFMEQSFGPLAVDNIPGKHCDFSTYLANRARDQFGACAEEQVPDYGTVLWSRGSRNDSRKTGKHCDFSSYLTKRARAQFVA